MLLIGLLFALAIAAFLVLGGKGSNSAIYKKFGLSEKGYKLISTDLGKQASRIQLSRLGIRGIPDAIFSMSTAKELVVGEFKSRRHRGIVRYYEFYQLMLYMGHLQAKKPSHTVRGVLAYADSKVAITFDKAVYEGLVEMRSEMKSALIKKKIPDKRPLHRRMKINDANPNLRFRVK